MSTKVSDEPLDLGVDELPDIEAKARDLQARGKSLNSDTSFNQAALDLLTKAIKLNPYATDTWIELTKCYQKKPDVEGAIACLENALKFSDKPNKTILRQLSTCLRQRDTESQEAKIAALLKSLDLAKQALRIDLNDEENYYNLSKAYMCLFFATECVDHQLINLSRAAYSKALALSTENHAKKNDIGSTISADACKDGVADAMSDPSLVDQASKPFIEQSDFLYNYSTVLVYFQEFEKALEYLRLAAKLDPGWTEPKLLEECLVDYLKQIQSMLDELGKNSKKVVRKYGKIVESLRSLAKIESEIQLDQQRLKSSSSIKIKSVSLDELEREDSRTDQANNNDEDPSHAPVKLLHLKLVSAINYNQAMYLTFIAIDQNYSMTVVTIYNLSASRCPSPRDVLTLVEPKIDRIKVSCPERDFSVIYKRIDAREFKGFYVNGHRISIDQVSKPQFRISVLP